MYFIITIFLISYLNIKISYLSKNEKEGLFGNSKLSKGYESNVKSDIKKKIQNLNYGTTFDHRKEISFF